MDLEEQYDCIYRYCYYRLRHVQMAEDITQEAFLRYFECERAEIGRPLAYLYTVARNLCIDEFRKKKLDTLSEEPPADGLEDGILDSLALRQALDTLTDYEKELVLLRYVNEVPAADMAEFYGISRFSLYREVKKVLKKLERRVSEYSV